jgi:phosphoglycolate phosphatase
MREEIGLPRGAPILETLAEAPPDQAARGWKVVEQHELAGAERAVRFAGAAEFVQTLAERGVRQAVLTRNSRLVAEKMLRLLPRVFERVVTREEGPVKPNPEAVWRICEQWGADVRRTALVGDSRFDVETGRRAGTLNVLFRRGRDLRRLEFAPLADHVLDSFANPEGFLQWLAGRVGKGAG